MKIEILERAIQIRKEIRRLENFIEKSKQHWKGELIEEKRKYLFKTYAFGTSGVNNIMLDRDMKDKVLKLFEDRLKELKEELRNL